MKREKRGFLFVLAALLILSLAGCGKKEESVTYSPPASQSSWPQASTESDGGSSGTASNESGGAGFTDPAVSESSKIDTAAIQEELNYLTVNRPEMLIDCTFCGGSGRESVPCSTCGGSGQVSIPGVTMFAAFAPCSDCRGDGYAVCSQCTFGLMENPDYEAESAAWTERRHDLWHQLGYSDDDIRRMEIDEAKAALNIAPDSGGMNEVSDSLDEYSPGQTVPGICRVCYGTGNCDTCGGDGMYRNMFTGEQQECPNCTDGRCWKCGGTGRDS